MNFKIALSLLLVLLFVNILPTEQKVITKTIQTKNLMKNGFDYFSKFGVNIGTGTINAKFRLQRKAASYVTNKMEKNEKLKIDFLILLDKEYEKIDENMSCKDKYNYATKKNEIYINTDGSWSEMVSQELIQNTRQYMWYFAVGSCENSVAVMDQFNFKLIVELEMLGVDNTHFSSEESGMLGLQTLILLGSLLAFGYLYSLYSKMKRDWPILYLLTSFSFLIGSIFFQVLHLWIYSGDGMGSLTFRIFSSILDILSQVALTVLLIQLSWGWSVTSDQLPDKELVIPSVVLISVLHGLIMGLGFVNDDTDFKYHQYDGWVGITIIILRLGCLGYFVYSINNVLQKTSGSIQNFAKQLTMWGVSYFVSIPLAVILGSFFAYYLQQRIITIGILIFQIMGISFLALSFMSKNSTYSKIAMRNRTELPSSFGSKFE